MKLNRYYGHQHQTLQVHLRLHRTKTSISCHSYHQENSVVPVKPPQVKSCIFCTPDPLSKSSSPTLTVWNYLLIYLNILLLEFMSHHWIQNLQPNSIYYYYNWFLGMLRLRSLHPGFHQAHHHTTTAVMGPSWIPCDGGQHLSIGNIGKGAYCKNETVAFAQNIF